MSFTKFNTSIFISNILHFSIKFALKNKKRIDDMRNFCDMLASILRIALIYSLNINDDFLSFKKLRVHLII
jgi:hypothetical protein